MNSFKITIERQVGASWPIVVEERASDTSLEVRSEGIVDLDLVALASQITPHDYGTMLGQALFQDTVREAFIRARAQSADHLSVQLFVEAPELRTLRWERLCAPLDGQWHFLLLDQRAPLTLVLPSPADRYFPPLGRADLRALILVASPQGLERYRLAPFDVAATVASVGIALGTIPYDLLSATPEAVGPPTLDALCERLTSTSYALLHIVCHGRYSPDIGETVLYLENEEQQVDPVTASRLLDRLSQLGGEPGLPHFAFLATCESAHPQAEAALGGLAQRLVRELGLPAVLAMTEPVSLHTAGALSSTFYRRLCAHGYPDLALSEACAGVAERPDSTVAALYSRQGARPLFEPQRPSPLTTSAEQQNRRALIHLLDKEYRRQLAQSLQGVAMMAVEAKERTDVVLSSVSLVSWRMDASDESCLPAPTSIKQAYDGAGSGLLLLGAAGAGKSTLLRELASELIIRAEQDVAQPVPVIVNLSSWAIKKSPLAVWLVDQLQLVYALPYRLSQLWIEQDQLLLLLDGLDEVELSARASCIEAINAYRAQHFVPVVVCSRSGEYLEQEQRLRLPVAVEVSPFTAEQVDAYLKGAGTPLAAVRTALRSNTLLRDLVRTPLMLSVVMLVYRGKTVEDLSQLGSAKDQQRQVFEQYVSRMLASRARKWRFAAHPTRQWLIWLAQQMKQRQLTEFYLERLQPTWLPTKRLQIVHKVLVVLVGGVLVELSLGLLGNLVLGQGFWLPVMLGVVLVSGLMRKSQIQPSEKLTWSWNSFLRGLVVGLAVALLFGLLFGLSYGRSFGLVDGLLTGLVFGLSVALLAALTVALLDGLSYRQVDEYSRLRPNQGIQASGWNALRSGLVVALVVALIFGLFGGLSYGQLSGLVGGLVGGLVDGLLSGLFFGLVVALAHGGLAYLQHYCLRFLLWHSRAMPWRYVRFLEEAHERILLQRVGGGYRFIHPLFQDYFASLGTPTPPQSVEPPPAQHP